MGASAVTITPDTGSGAPPPVTITPDTGDSQPSALSRLGHNLLSGLGVTDDAGAKAFFEHPINTLMQSTNAQGELAKKAKDAYDRGDYKSAIIHGLNYLVPFVGQQTDKAGEQLSQGDYAGGIGRTLGTAIPILASPEARAAVSDTASAAASAVKPALSKAGSAATAVGESLDPDVVGLVSPRLAHGLRMASKVGKVATKAGGTAAAPEAAAAADAAEVPAEASRAELPAGFQSVATPPPGSAENPFQARAAASAEQPVTRTPPELPAGFRSVAAPPPGSAENPFQAPAAARTLVTDPATGRPEFSDVLAAKTSAEPAAPAPDTSPANVGKLLNDATGGKPLEPGAPIYNRAAAKTSAAKPSDIPEGFTPVQSSVLKGYKYDPSTQEFDGITNTGQVYRHAEVTPDQFQKFESADSKGKAWNDLRGNSTPLGKVNNGVLQPRIPLKPRTVVMDPTTGAPEFSDVVAAKQNAPQPAAAPAAQPAAQPQPQAAAAGEGDLAPWQQTLDQVKAAKNAAAQRATAGVPSSAYDDVINKAMQEGPAWTPEKAQPVVSALNKNPGVEFEARGSVGEGRSTSNDLDLYQKQGSLTDAHDTLKGLGFKRVAKTPHGETWTNGAQHIDLWDSATEPIKGYSGAPVEASK